LKVINNQLFMSTKNKNASAVQGTDSKEVAVQGKNLPAIIKPAPNLEKTLDIVTKLHQKQMQRARMIVTQDTLQKFEIKRSEEEAESGSSYYGCKLSITDDERREFKTENPIIIQKVVDYLKQVTAERQALLEAEIVIPAA
jgi:hypothetical protein